MASRKCQSGAITAHPATARRCKSRRPSSECESMMLSGRGTDSRCGSLTAAPPPEHAAAHRAVERGGTEVVRLLHRIHTMPEGTVHPGGHGREQIRHLRRHSNANHDDARQSPHPGAVHRSRHGDLNPSHHFIATLRASSVREVDESGCLRMRAPVPITRRRAPQPSSRW